MRIQRYACDYCSEESLDKKSELIIPLTQRSQIQIKFTLQESEFGSLTWADSPYSHVCKKCVINMLKNQIALLEANAI